MLEVDKTAMPAVSIYDYADQKSRGIVEGYYGYPYSVSVKKDLMRFMMRYKMNTYLYGAKSDPYHSEKWKEDYPASITEEQKKMDGFHRKWYRMLLKYHMIQKLILFGQSIRAMIFYTALLL